MKNRNRTVAVVKLYLILIVRTNFVITFDCAPIAPSAQKGIRNGLLLACGPRNDLVSWRMVAKFL